MIIFHVSLLFVEKFDTKCVFSVDTVSINIIMLLEKVQHLIRVLVIECARVCDCVSDALEFIHEG